LHVSATIALLVPLATCTVTPGAQRAETVVYASGADLQSINPLFTVHPLAKAVQKHVLFMTLASYDRALRPVPRLATWEWHDGRRALGLSLRGDVVWHDGVPTTAADVRWTLEMARHPRVAYPRAADLEQVEDVVVHDSLTLTIRFDRPQPQFPDVLTDLAILPRHQLADVEPGALRTAPFNAAPIGNGPFTFVDYRPNQRWVFERQAGFPQALGAPAIARFVIAVVDEPATKLAALTSGELDFAGIAPAHAAFVDDDPRLETVDYPVMFVYALVWNLRRAPFDDPAVRRALTMALDRELIVEAYLYGFGTLADGPVPPEHPWFVPVERVPFDTAGASRLLHEAGWTRGSDGVRTKDGVRLAFDLLTVGSGTNALEQMVQAQLGRVGADVSIHQRELTSFLALAQGADRDFDALVTGIPGDLALSYARAMFTGRDPGPLAYPGYESVAFDGAMDAVRMAATPAELAAAWQRAQRVLARDLPTAWLYHARGLQGKTRRIRAAPPDLRGELAGITEWTVAPEEASQ
jgi:peptide/nickel transport system substrate-binding protein